MFPGRFVLPDQRTSDGFSFTRRSSWAFSATTMVETLMTSAPMLIGSMKPHGASTPAATGMAIAL